MIKYKNSKIKPENSKRESPQDFMQAFSKYVKKTKRTTLTPKAFAIIRGQNEK